MSLQEQIQSWTRAGYTSHQIADLAQRWINEENSPNRDHYGGKHSWVCHKCGRHHPSHHDECYYCK